MNQGQVADLSGQEKTLLARTAYGSRVQMLERIAFRAPDSMQAWTHLTAALVEAGELDRAAITSAVLEHAEQEWSILLLRSQALTKADLRTALGLARQAVELAPDEYQAHLQLARCQLAAGDPDEGGLSAAARAVRLSRGAAEALQVQRELEKLHSAGEVVVPPPPPPAEPDTRDTPAPASRPARRAGLRGSVSRQELSYLAVLMVLLSLAAINGIAVLAHAVDPFSGLPSAALLTMTTVGLVVLRSRPGA